MFKKRCLCNHEFLEVKNKRLRYLKCVKCGYKTKFEKVVRYED